MEGKDTGILIKDIRESMGMSASELAENANISRNYLNRIERGLNENISLEVGVNLSKILSEAPDVKNRIINLNNYNSPLAQLITSEVVKEENKINYVLGNELVKSIVNSNIDNEELGILLKYIQYVSKMKYIKRQILYYNDALKYLQNKNGEIEKPIFSEALSWLMLNTDIGDEFNNLINSLIVDNEADKLIEWSGMLIHMLADYLRYINGEEMLLEFNILNKEV